MPRRTTPPPTEQQQQLPPITEEPTVATSDDDATPVAMAVKPTVIKPPTFGRALVEAGLIRDGLSDREIKQRVQEACERSRQHIVSRRHLAPFQL
jgi:D-serine deaminase-like pyridoxal phosphate-dependent protein